MVLPMTCKTIKRRSAEFIDGRMRRREQARVEAHLRECDACAVLVYDLRSVRMSLEDLAAPQAPGSLRSKLMVLASRERQLLLENGGSRWMRIWNRWQLRMREYMRPLTIPATGGVVTTVLLFGSLALSTATNRPAVAYEVPIAYADHGDATLVPLDLRSSVVLTMSLDGHGHITDYAAHDRSQSFVGNVSHLQYNKIPLPEFPSVLRMEEPTIGDIQISFVPIVFQQ